MKKFFYSLLLYILIFSFVAGIFNGITLPQKPLYWFLSGSVFAVAIMLYAPLLKFLTVKKNFITFWITSTILVFGVLFSLDLLMPGFRVNSTIVDSKSFELITIETFELTKIWTIAGVAGLSAFISAMFNELKKSSASSD